MQQALKVYLSLFVVAAGTVFMFKPDSSIFFVEFGLERWQCQISDFLKPAGIY